jgi:hypothetical protein
MKQIPYRCVWSCKRTASRVYGPTRPNSARLSIRAMSLLP